MPKRLYFVRHGETEGNRDGVLQGADDKLSPEGEKQAMKIAERAKMLTFQKIISSDIVRARATAEAIANATGISVTFEPLLREIARPSSMIGLPRSSEQFVNFVREEYENFDNPNWRFEDAENFEDVRKRVEDIIALLMNEESESILVVTHGHFLRFMTAYLITKGNLTPAIWRDVSRTFISSNTGLTVFQYYSDEWKLLTWNDRAHFAE